MPNYIPPTFKAAAVSTTDTVGDTSRLHTPRAVARRWRSLGTDLGLGLVAALAALRFAGLALIAVLAIPLLLLCTLSLGVARLRSRGASR